MNMPKPLSWRKTVAWWPPDIRERYGKMCNRLEDEGVKFPESEWIAFQQVIAFLSAYEKKYPDKPIPFVMPYHTRAVDTLGRTVWVPQKLADDTNWDNSFELDREGLAFLMELNRALRAITIHKRKLSDHARSIAARAQTDVRKQSPDDGKIVVKKSGRGRKFKHSDKVKGMF